VSEKLAPAIVGIKRRSDIPYNPNEINSRITGFLSIT